MPSPETNRQNAQSSTGPRTDEGKKRSSLNATSHGLTAQSLYLTEEERKPYEDHCIAFLEHYNPANHVETELLQQYSDLTWRLHQIAVQELNTFAIINALTAQLLQEGDLSAMAPALAPHYRTLNNLSIYEQRRRRAAEAVLAQFNALVAARKQQIAEAAKVYSLCKSSNQPCLPADFGFVCSIPEIESYLHRSNRLTEAKKLLAAA